MSSFLFESTKNGIYIKPQKLKHTLLIKCSNLNCQSVYPVESIEKAEATNFLCPSCSTKSESYHIIQCSYCLSIINFIPADSEEIPTVFQTNKCRNCNGTYDDERKIKPIIYSEDFI